MTLFHLRFCESTREWHPFDPADLFLIYMYLVEDDDAHDLALDDDDAALVVDADAARVLQDVGTELAHELAVLVVYLHLKRMNNDWALYVY